jgi:FixJ family two-component response regulator
MKNPFRSNPRTFVVDDEEDIAKMLVVVLQMNLFDAIPYTDPAEALEAARLEAPDYLISDIVMPGMNGIELAIAIQAVAPACKVLLFSGRIDAAEMVRTANEQGHRFELLQKPVHPKVLVDVLQTMAEQVEAEAGEVDGVTVDA